MSLREVSFFLDVETFASPGRHLGAESSCAGSALSWYSVAPTLARPYPEAPVPSTPPTVLRLPEAVPNQGFRFPKHIF